MAKSKAHKHGIIEKMALVSMILAKHDSEGLIKIGCPPDEYDPEAVELVARIRDQSLERMPFCDSPHVGQRIAILCVDVFNDLFGTHAAHLRKHEIFMPAALEIATVSECRHGEPCVHDAWLVEKRAL